MALQKAFLETKTLITKFIMIKVFIRLLYFILRLLPNKNTKMDIGHRMNRINRLKLKNIADLKPSQFMQTQHKIFKKINRNQAILSEKFPKSEQITDESDMRAFNQESSITEHLKRPREIQKSTSLFENRSLSKDVSDTSLKRLLKKGSMNDSIFSLSRPKDPLKYPSPTKKAKAFQQFSGQMVNEISGTSMGSLSSEGIINKYEAKLKREQERSYKFNRSYIRHLKIEAEQDEERLEMIEQSKSLSLIPLISKTVSINRSSKGQKSVDLQIREERLLSLLQNRLSDSDYSDYNKKLFEKKDLNKKKLFSRYHKILQKQRESIDKSQAIISKSQSVGRDSQN